MQHVGLLYVKGVGPRNERNATGTLRTLNLIGQPFSGKLVRNYEQLKGAICEK